MAEVDSFKSYFKIKAKTDLSVYCFYIEESRSTILNGILILKVCKQKQEPRLILK